ncbi:MAG: type I-G CRISPR-associated protein Csb2 [Opitutaceae bacterium]
MHLEIEVVFTAGHFHGEEWPPAPARLFQALIAATHRGARKLLHAEVRDQALRWLETLEPPVIVAVEANSQERELLTNYVPNNDDKLGINGHIRTAKNMACHVLGEGRNHVSYRWQIPDEKAAAQNADVVSTMAPLVTYFGRSVDLVYARGRLTEQPSTLGEGIYRCFQPVVEDGGRWLSPAPGFLELCQARYPQSVSQAPPDFTNSRQVHYTSNGASPTATPTAVFELWKSDETRLSFAPRDLRQPSGMARHALQTWASENPKIAEIYGADLIARFLHGHRNASSPEPSEGGHIAIVPLPTANANFTADGWLRRIALIGFGCEADQPRALFNDAARGLHGAALLDRGAIVGQLRKSSLRLSGPWTGSGTMWRSVTPIVLPGYMRKGRSRESLVLRALLQANIDVSNVDSIVASNTPFVPKSSASNDYRVQDYLSVTPRCHAEVIFKKAMVGPLVVGRGRYVGFGLMLPWTST